MIFTQQILSAEAKLAEFKSERRPVIPRTDLITSLCQNVPKKRGRGGQTTGIILSVHDSRVSQPTNLSPINDNNTLAGLFSASSGCHPSHF